MDSIDSNDSIDSKDSSSGGGSSRLHSPLAASETEGQGAEARSSSQRSTDLKIAFSVSPQKGGTPGREAGG